MSITLHNISHAADTKLLFEEVSVAFNPEKRYGLTGPNGSGKSTLLKIIMGQVKPLKGTIHLPRKVGFLRQNIEAYRDFIVRDVVVMGNERLWKALEEKNALYDVPYTDEIGLRFGTLEEVIAEEDGYVADAKAEELLAGSGIPEEFFERPMKDIPQDFQFRVLLCQALFGDPEALLLDEPTNHLDLHSIDWLETFLKEYKGTLIVVSHDRHFLNAVCTHTADIDYETVIIYPGNYDQMVVAKSSVEQRKLNEARSKEKKIAQLKEFVAKFGAGTRASQVQSRLREIDRLTPEELKKSNIQRPYIRFPLSPEIPGKLICKIEKLSKSYNTHKVLDQFSLEIYRGDKIGIIGNNGLGKTTLIKSIAQLLTPDSGKVEIGHQVHKAYFPQLHAEVLSKKEDISVYEWLRNLKDGLYDQEIRSVLGKLLFSGDDAFKNVATLSGGETARLIIAGLMLDNHNFLLFDEPNNHLDLESVNALAWSLQEYKGTAVVVTHDRELLNHFATKIIAFEKDGMHIFDGTLEDYLKSRGE